MDNAPSNRTLRRREKKERISELLQDLDTVQKLIDRAIHPRAVEGYTALYDTLYKEYITVVSSEV
jgi:hypothetical protein